MTYVCSDIHGAYSLFIKLLAEINFGPNDSMIICGDVIDKGKDSVRLLKFVLEQPNITLIMGNHEYDFVKRYYALLKSQSDCNYDNVLHELQLSLGNDGNMLTWQMVDQIELLPYFVETDTFVCVHAGIPVKSDNTLQSLDVTLPEQFVYDREFKEPYVLPKTDKCVFFGHTPCYYITNQHKIITYSKVATPHVITDYVKIHIDTGTYLGGVLGCFCVETCKEYYVK